MSVASAQKRRKVLIAAAAATVLAGVMVYGLSQAARSPGTAPGSGPAAPTAGQLTDVIALASDLPIETKITAAQLTKVKFPTALVTADNITDIRWAVDKVNFVPLLANAVLLKSELADNFVTPQALKLHPGDVAVAIPFDEAKGFGGYVHPEDRFDVLCDSGDGGPAFYCFTDIRVIEVGGRSVQPAAATASPGAAAGAATPAAVAPGAAPIATNPPNVVGASVLVVEMSRADAARIRGTLLIATGKGAIVAYVLRAYADGSSSAGTPAPPTLH